MPNFFTKRIEKLQQEEGECLVMNCGMFGQKFLNKIKQTKTASVQRDIRSESQDRGCKDT